MSTDDITPEELLALLDTEHIDLEAILLSEHLAIEALLANMRKPTNKDR